MDSCQPIERLKEKKTSVDSDVSGQTIGHIFKVKQYWTANYQSMLRNFQKSKDLTPETWGTTWITSLKTFTFLQ